MMCVLNTNDNKERNNNYDIHVAISSILELCYVFTHISIAQVFFTNENDKRPIQFILEKYVCTESVISFILITWIRTLIKFTRQMNSTYRMKFSN